MRRFGLEREKLEQAPEKQAVRVQFAGVLQQRPHERLRLDEGSKEHRQGASRHLSLNRLPHNPTGCTSPDHHSQQRRQQLPGNLPAHEAGLFATKPLPQRLIRADQMIAEVEDPNFRGGFASGEQVLQIPRLSDLRRRLSVPVLTPQRVAEHKPQRREAAQEERERQPHSVGQEDGGNAD